MPCVHRRRLGQIHRHVLRVVLIDAVCMGDSDAVAIELLLIDEVADQRGTDAASGSQVQIRRSRSRRGVPIIINMLGKPGQWGGSPLVSWLLNDYSRVVSTHDYLNDDSRFSSCFSSSSISPSPLLGLAFLMFHSGDKTRSQGRARAPGRRRGGAGGRTTARRR